MIQDTQAEPPFTVDRSQLLSLLCWHIQQAMEKGRATLVGLDGVDLSGKTTLARELESALTGIGHSVCVIHEDDFVNPRSVRTRQGQWLAQGFYDDFFDFQSLIAKLLRPLRRGEQVECTILKLDFVRDSWDTSIIYSIQPSQIVIVEGLFLVRPEFSGCFDIIVRLSVPASVVLQRAIVRDVPIFGDADYVIKGYELQSIPAQELYEQQCKPDEHADVVIDNTDVSNPTVLAIRARPLGG